MLEEKEQERVQIAQEEAMESHISELQQAAILAATPKQTLEGDFFQKSLLYSTTLSDYKGYGNNHFSNRSLFLQSTPFFTKFCTLLWSTRRFLKPLHRYMCHPTNEQEMIQTARSWMQIKNRPIGTHQFLIQVKC